MMPCGVGARYIRRLSLISVAYCKPLADNVCHYCDVLHMFSHNIPVFIHYYLVAIRRLCQAANKTNIILKQLRRPCTIADYSKLIKDNINRSIKPQSLKSFSHYPPSLQFHRCFELNLHISQRMQAD